MWRDPEGCPAMVNNGAFNNDFLNQLIEEWKDKVETGKHLSNEDGVMTTNNKVRDSDVVFFSHPDLERTLLDLVLAANNMMGYDWDITSYEAPQFTKYEKNQHYYWHQDMGMGSRGRKFIPDHNQVPKGHNAMDYIPIPQLIGTVRKMSITLLLNDPKEYKGGEFQTQYCTKGKLITNTYKGKQGSVYIFPSWLEHRVKPVKQGTRYSIVMWFCGPPLK